MKRTMNVTSRVRHELSRDDAELLIGEKLEEDVKNWIVIDPSNTYAYVANDDKTKVFRIDLRTFTVSAVLDIGRFGVEEA